MNRQKSVRFSVLTGVLFVLAVVLLLFSAIGSTRAALIYSKTYVTAIHTEDIGIALSGTDDPLEAFIAAGENWVPGKHYTGVVSVINTATIDEYVRVIIHKYWATGANKDTTLDPSLIHLDISDGWLLDPAASTPEQIVLYRPHWMASGDSAPVLEGVTIDNAVVTTVTRTDHNDGTVTNNYIYDGKRFGIEIEADGVQTHHPEDAILSAWGVVVEIDEKTEEILPFERGEAQ